MRMGSVQDAFVAVRDIVDGVLCLAWGGRTSIAHWWGSAASISR